MIEITFNQNTIEYLLILLVRVSSFIFICPFFGESGISSRIKISLSIWITVLMFYSMPISELNYIGVIGYASMVVKEAITGLLIGFSAYICNTIIHFSGKIIDMDIGLSMAQVFDPGSNISTGLTGSLYYRFIMLFMIVSNMHIFLLNALVDSYKLVPINGIKLGDTMYNTVVGFMTEYFIIGFRIILPIFASILLLNCVLGIMARVAPQMNMFAVGMQLKIMVGFFVMFITVAVLPRLSSFIFSVMQSMVKGIIQGMV